MEQLIEPAKKLHTKPNNKPAMTEAFDKTGWAQVCFGDVCRNLNETSRDPLADGFERYVGLEHIEPNNLHIKSWGAIADGTTFTKTFRAGHVLFGKRRAYLRKAALAEFDGLCSGDILVLEANEEMIDPMLFPFLVQSDRFFDFAVQTSAGSLSPRTKFQDLAKFEFLLPPKKEQAKLAELLWAVNEVVEKKQTLANSLQILAQVLFDSVYQSKSLKVLTLKDCLEYSQYGISETLNEVGELPVLRMNNIVNGEVSFDEIKFINKRDVLKLESLLLTRGDILFNRTNSFDLVGKVGIFDRDREATFASYLIRLKANHTVVLPKYLNYYLNSKRGQAAIKLHRTPGVSQSNINPENLKKIDVPVISVAEQKTMIKKIKTVKKSEEDCKSSVAQLKNVMNTLTSQIFS